MAAARVRRTGVGGARACGPGLRAPAPSHKQLPSPALEKEVKDGIRGGRESLGGSQALMLNS